MPITAISRETPPASPPLQPATYEEALANAEPGDTIATTKEEEWVTRKKSEVTTTRQIATRVKRELLLEDGRILSDSGPKVSTSVNEDTHTTNYQQTEHRVPDDQVDQEDPALDGNSYGAIGAARDELDAVLGTVVAPAGTKVLVSSRVVANPDGKVRESRDLKVLTRNVTDRVKETEERFHRGDTTHEALIAAVNETSEEDIRDALKAQTDHHLALVPSGPKLIKDTVGYNTVINTDDTRELRALRADGTIVTERKHTKEQERLGDEELNKDEARSLASDKSLEERTGGTERRKRVDLEKKTDLMAGGLRVSTQLHSRTRTEEAEREGRPNMEDDWDSLSVRIRRQRRLRQSELDKDYSKRPLDFDIEEETRKKETSKWLESHFGSESRSSHDSIADEIGRRPETGYYVKKQTTVEDEGYYGKTSSSDPPPPVYADRVLRKTNSSTPSDERVAPPKNRTGGYFKGVADWSQRRASKPKMPEPRSSSPSPLAVRSPYASNDRLNGSSPRHVYGKRDSPQGRSSPIGRRHPPSRDDSAYVSSSTMHSPPRGSPFRPLETDRSFREPSVEDDYRPPVAPERKRHLKQRLSEEHRYDSGYRSSSRNENSGRSRDSREESAVEPPPDYSPPQERRGSSERTLPRRRDRDERKQNQKTRFADNGRRPSPARKSVGSAIGNSIRKLVGKIRSASAERKARWRNSRSPSPDHSSRTYKQYSGEISPPAPPHRYYLGEDPFAPSIYGREHKYEGSSRRAAAVDARDHRERGQFSSTLGRLSQSTSRLNPNSETEEDYSRSAQTLPRKLHDRKEKTTEKPSSNKYWHRLTPSKRSSSAVNISHQVTTSPDGKTNGYPPGPAKPARTYKALNRSKSFAMGAPEQETHPRYSSGMSRNYSTMYKSNPHLTRLDETPEQLKSPGIVSIINRSQRDLADAVSRETERRRDGIFGTRYGKTTPVTNGHSNGYHKSSYDETDKKKLFLKGLRERAPDLYQTLHADDESDGSRMSPRYGTPSPLYKDRVSEERKIPVYKTDSLNRETSPYVSRLETRLKSPTHRRGSNSSDNYSETYRYTTRSGDPERPSVTDTVETVSKKVLPTRDGRGKEIIESREVNSITKRRGYKGEPISSKYIENGIRSSPLGYESKNGISPLYSERRSSNYKLIEKMRDF